MTPSDTIHNISPRNESLDLIRGICMLLVLADHTGFGTPHRETAIYHMLDHIEVVGFFVVSGFLLKTTSNLWHFIRKSAIRLLIPFIIFDLLYVAVLSTIGRGWEQGIQDMPTLKWCLIGPGNGPLWFLRALFIGGVAYAILDRYIFSKVPVGVAGIIALLISIAAFVPAGYTDAHNSIIGGGNMLISKYINFNISGGLNSIVWIWLGANMHRYDIPSRITASPIKTFVPILFICICIWTVLSIGHIDLSRSFIAHPYSFYPAAAAGTFVLFLCACKIKSLPFINYIGRNSLTVLGSHLIFIAIIVNMIGITNPYCLLPITILTIPVSIICDRYARAGYSNMLALIR